MNFNRLLHEISSAQFLAMTKSGADHYRDAVQKLLTREQLTSADLSKIDNRSFPVVYSAGKVAQKLSGNWMEINQDLPENSTIAINIEGAIMKNDYCGAPGSATIAGWIEKADANPNVSTILLLVDSPGGMVAGTKNLVDAISKAQTKTVAHINNMAASAAMWIISAADEAYASQRIDQIGSIGTYITLLNPKGYYEENGFVIEEVYADASFEKNEEFREWEESGKTAKIKEHLNFINAEFINSVKQNRPQIKTDTKYGNPFNGKIFNAEAAVEVGLIDGIKSLNELLSGSDQNITNNQNHVQMKQFTLLNAALGVATLEAHDGHVSLNQDQLTAIEADLKSNEDLQAKLKVAEKDLGAKSQKVEDLQAAEKGISTALETACDANEVEVDEESTAEDRVEALSGELKNYRKGNSSTPKSGAHRDSDEQEEAYDMPSWNKKLVGAIH